MISCSIAASTKVTIHHPRPLLTKEGRKTDDALSLRKEGLGVVKEEWRGKRTPRSAAPVITVDSNASLILF